MQSYKPKSDEVNKSAYLCLNCSDEVGQVKKLYCALCATKVKREQMKQDNEAAQVHLKELEAKKQWIYAQK